MKFGRGTVVTCLGRQYFERLNAAPSDAAWRYGGCMGTTSVIELNSGQLRRSHLI
jgi:hypothetical protein